MQLLCLGNRRLSILDLVEKGRQPMSINAQLVITDNEEIYLGA
jgi:asparagine synthetase B (glutamine-hydrolysing)